MSHPSPFRFWSVVALILCAGLFSVGAWISSRQERAFAQVSGPVTASVVSEKSCVGCHQTEAAVWKNSHHARAMAPARADSVLGDFNDAAFTHNGVTSRFFRKEGGFWVTTDGPDGRMGSFRVAYTFGVLPLQQYLIEMPGGQLQALGIAWDVAGKRWYHLYPQNQRTFRDELHWTKPQQNANFMCIECHVTDFKRNFDPVSNSFNSSWQALGVGCQSCHGPASKHVAWAEGVRSVPVAGAGFEVPLKGARQQTVVETCARCHARRAPLGDGFRTTNRLADDYALSLLADQFYHVDGQFKEEAFEWGSFAQSKMFMAGVTCVNCHEPHSGTLRKTGNAVCMQCHGTDEKLRDARYYIPPPQQKNYDSVEHTRHTTGASGSYCVDCHMPGKYYMGVDFRHDHSLRIPRPDLAEKLATPDACTNCHAERTPRWAAERITEWFGPRKPDQTYGEAMWKVRHGAPGAADALKGLMQSSDTPPINRATALAEIGRYPSDPMIRLAVDALKDNDPLVRVSAVNVLGMVPPAARVTLLSPLLEDPVRLVRVTAARALVATRSQLKDAQLAAWQKGIAEFRAVQNSLSERAESHLNLAGLARDMGDTAEMRREIELALARDPAFPPAIALKAEYMAVTGQSNTGLALLRDAVAEHSSSGLLRHALGMAQIRAGDRAAALQSLRAAWEMEPGNATFGYIYAVALNDTGDRQGAIAELDKVMAAHPDSRDAAMIAIRYRIAANDTDGAQAIARRWLAVSPDEPTLGNPARRKPPP